MTSPVQHPRSVDDLPEDPLGMPPPYWRSSGAIFHIKVALADMHRKLKRLPALMEKKDSDLNEFLKKYKTKRAREAAENEHWKIVSRPFATEHDIKLSGEIACLMSAIEAEDRVNCFCVFNLHKNVAESIEKLSLAEKLLIACTMVGAPEVKGLPPYEAAKKLMSWRNAFAHGHCVDRPTKSLRHNHLISPPEYPGVPSALRDVKAMVGAYLEVSDYLRTKSNNQYLRSPSLDDEDIRRTVKQVSRFTFVGSNWHYTIGVLK